MKLPHLSTLLVGAVVLALVVGGAVLLFAGGGQKTLTADFPRAISVYKGSDVRVLGVPVGKVEEVEPNGTSVTVTMTYDETVELPKNGKAVIVSPSIVGDRYIQMIPAYTGGPVMADGARLGLDSTADPLELDEVYSGIDDLLVAVGPNGANKDGALSNLLDTTAANLAGNGEQLNRTITNLGKFTTTLANNKDDLFGTITEVQRFVRILAENDATVRRFNDSLAGAADLLEGERDDLAAALRNLGTALTDVRGFVQQNRGTLSRNITDLNKLTKILVGQRKALEDILTDAPLALNNLYLVYNPSAGTLDTRANLTQGLGLLQEDPVKFLCGILRTQPGGKQACNNLEKPLSDLAGQLPLPKPGAARAATGGTVTASRSAQYGDASLAGILGGGR